ncbi:type II toxin-antitoxin system HipA family toxin [Candidatus Nucleicultrix amoebiphila]|jgi:serine/threonine-protein kinase HipA|uniref:Kinase n=1 Tax=Candidatus Nucleicultrix amoebiphila FS5 TaxID=1414854 RepID=A0A1W6N5D5_9PROT|nr:type II toxin-antitoxin system HipA family toxin [Candidatus Nucleicultrix amoebiphila]ARN85090.1 hypothetical protein GQ61_07070 [Candidatus Nucleicultrix amoebiphila FS5]
MAKSLDVYLEDKFVGNLIQDNHGQMLFSYAEIWLENPNAIPLSQSLPLRKDRFSPKECRGFFAGILPEQSMRKTVATILGISSENDFSMLERIGGECAGAVVFIPSGEKLQTSFNYQEINEQELAKILRELPHRPLMAGEQDIRLSLAGVQDKVAVRILNDKISIPHGIAPSTHILKPAIERFEGTVFNEALCMGLADAIGLSTAKIEIGRAEDIDYLIVERYDRMMLRINPELIQLIRLHQEDFCQALGIVPEKKYQSEEGPSLKQCFEILRKVSSAPVIDLQRLLDAVIFNFLVGNHDAHGKNFSLLYNLTTSNTRLAPLYDILSTDYYPTLSKKMAMKIGDEYLSEKIQPKHFEELAEEAGLSKPFVKRRVPDLAQMILSKLPEVVMDHPVSTAVAKLIQNRCERRIREFK